MPKSASIVGVEAISSSLAGRLRCLVGFTAVMLLVAANASAQSYQWRDVVQEVEIRPTGDVYVSDTRTLWTDEDFGEAFICLDLTPPALSPDLRPSVTLQNTSAALGSGPNWQAFTQPCEVNGGQSGTELVIRNDRRIAERRVRFDYVLHGSVKAYSDVVEWYWHILEPNHPPVIGYRLVVRAPGGMLDPYDAYVHTLGNPERPRVSLSEDRSTLNVAFDRVPPTHGVEIRYLMDPALFDIRGTASGFQMLLEDETRVAGIDERRAGVSRVRQHPLWGLLALAALGAYGAGVIRNFRQHGREPRLLSMQYPFEPPSNLPPAAVTALQMQRFSASAMGPALHATIMDLARLGFAEFRPKGKKLEMKLDLQKDTSQLEGFERDVLAYLKAAAAGNRRGDDSFLEFDELKKYSQSRAASFMPRWSQSVRSWVERLYGGKLLEPESVAAANRWALRGLLVVALFVLGAVVLAGTARGLFIAAGSLSLVVIIVASVAVPRWRSDVAEQVYGWQGFKRTLTDYTRMKDAPHDFFRLWDRYFVYAAALGVAEKYLRAVRRAAPLAGVDEATMVRQGAWMGGSSSFSNLSSLTSSISSLSSALSAASASASSGGSSSGGGGGGGGGGSSGGR